MTPAARIMAQIEILDEILGQPKPADGIMSAYFRARKFIGSKDRSAVASAVYGILRRYMRLEWHLSRAEMPTMGRYLVLAHLALVDGWPPAKITDHFTGERYAPPRLREDELFFLSPATQPVLEPPEMPQHVRLECPADYAEKFAVVFGDDFETEMRAMQVEAKLDLRVNPRVTTRETAIIELRKAGIKVSATPYSPWGIRVEGRPALPTFDLFKRGGVEIQDEGSQLIALLVDARPGEAVVDFCAGAGGKTLAIAAMMENKGRVVACDVLDGRLARSRVRFTRAGLDNIQTRPLTSENDKWVKRSAGTFDRVLVDAPCSGTGVWRRNPDARWKQLGPALTEIVPLQASILRSAARLVKPGGRLVYATCSLLPEENQLQVEAFLAAHPDFRLMPLAKAIGECAAYAAGETGANALTDSLCSPDYMALTPHRHGTDGFFAAVMVRG
jgi:16S rRNA (cytosine967-C5)-methyltransferase